VECEGRRQEEEPEVEREDRSEKRIIRNQGDGKK
jgi:hypothetical protein